MGHTQYGTDWYVRCHTRAVSLWKLYVAPYPIKQIGLVYGNVNRTSSMPITKNENSKRLKHEYCVGEKVLLE